MMTTSNSGQTPANSGQTPAHLTGLDTRAKLRPAATSRGRSSSRTSEGQTSTLQLRPNSGQSLQTKPCPRCRGEEYLDGDNGMVLCPRCCGTGDA